MRESGNVHGGTEYLERPADDWSGLSAEEKKEKLFRKQKELLDTFLEHGAISEAQYRKSLTDLSRKMGIAV